MKLYGMYFHNKGYPDHFIAASHEVEKLQAIIPTLTISPNTDGSHDGKMFWKTGLGRVLWYAETATNTKYSIIEMPLIV